MKEKEKRKQVAKISVFITSIFVIFLSVTYAFINQTLIGTKRQVITAGNLELELQEDENNLTITDAMPMYDEVGMIQEAFTFRLINKTATDTNYIIKLVDIEIGEKLDTSIVKYGLTKDGTSTIKLLSTLTNGEIDSGTISGNQTINYSLRLWIDSSVEGNITIEGKSLSYRIDIEASQDGIVSSLEDSVSQKVFQNENLGESCKTYNDGVDTFLVGQCQNNYVWYSGKLWRVVLKNNETGAVKLITDNAMTVMSYNASENPDFENSYADQWLSQEFLPTLHDYEKYLVIDSVWNITMNDSDSPTRPDGTTTINRTVGLLNGYEYYTTYNNSDGLATYSTGYLNNDTCWWLLTPFNTSYVQYVVEIGSLVYDNPNELYGTRPVVNLKSEIQITSGEGTLSNPYRVVGDEQETLGGTTLLNTRYSGEYVNFNNQLYRIVGIENNLTKIISVDKPAELKSNRFHKEDGVANFANASIKTDLENYYQNNVIESYKSMIEPNTTWYLGTVGMGENYKASICTRIDTSVGSKACEKTIATTTANIGLPRIGEMFTAQIINKRTDFFLTLTPKSETKIIHICSGNSLKCLQSSYSYGARPSIYLKSTVKIASSNTGNGTYESPYDLELSE